VGAAGLGRPKRQTLKVGLLEVLRPHGALGGVERAIGIYFAFKPLQQPAATGFGSGSAILGVGPGSMPGDRRADFALGLSEWYGDADLS
jgi:hypothetical protein